MPVVVLSFGFDSKAWDAACNPLNRLAHNRRERRLVSLKSQLVASP